MKWVTKFLRVTELHIAAEQNDVETIRRILSEPGADVDVTDGFGFTPLHYAAFGDAAEAIRLLAGAGAKHLFSNGGFDESDYAPVGFPFLGHQPLHVAIAAGRVKAFKALLDADAPLDAASPDGTPLEMILHRYPASGSGEMLDALLDKLEEVKKRSPEAAKRIVSKRSVSDPLALAILKAPPRIVERLARLGGDYNGVTRAVVGGVPYDVPYISLAAARRPQLVPVLVGLGVDVNRVTWGAASLGYVSPLVYVFTLFTARMVAEDKPVGQRLLDALLALLDAGADPNAGSTPALHAAILWAAGWVDRSGFPAAVEAALYSVRLLLSRGAKPDARDRWGRTSLLLAVRALYDTKSPLFMPVVEELVAAGADPNAADEDGASPLGEAIRVALHGRVDDETADRLLDLLLDAGGDPAATDATGEPHIVTLIRSAYLYPAAERVALKLAKRLRGGEIRDSDGNHVITLVASNADDFKNPAELIRVLMEHTDYTEADLEEAARYAAKYVAKYPELKQLFASAANER